MSHIYTDGTYLKNNPDWHQQESFWKAKHVIEVIKRNNLHPSSICDIGCGAGEVLRLLSEQLSGDTTFRGYEISPQAYEICSKKSGRNLTFHLCDLLEEEATFDLLLALDVVEHIEDFHGFLRKLKSKARYKLFHIPLDLCVQKLLRISTMLEDMEHVGHIHSFTKETAMAALKRTGYTIVECSYIGKRLELPLRGWRPKLLKIPRKIFCSISRDLSSRVLGGWSLSVLAE